MTFAPFWTAYCTHWYAAGSVLQLADALTTIRPTLLEIEAIPILLLVPHAAVVAVCVPWRQLLSALFEPFIALYCLTKLALISG